MCATGRDPLRTRQTLLGRLIDWNDDASWQEFDAIYRGLIHNFALKQGVAEDDVQDVVQETLYRVAKALRKGQYDPQKGSFRSWLRTVTHNCINDYFRRNPRWRKAVRVSRTDTSRTSAIDVPDPRSLTPEAIWDEEWANNVMELALEQLKTKVKPKSFQIFHLNFIKELPAAMVAKALGVRRGQVYLVKSRLKETFEQITRNLQRELEARPGWIRRGRGSNR